MMSDNILILPTCKKQRKGPPPELCIFRSECGQELADGHAVLEIPPRNQKLESILFTLTGLPLYDLQIAGYSTTTS
ncbi:hypothetical protein KC19_VG001500, partial [Ceratodon purpureus]